MNQNQCSMLTDKEAAQAMLGVEKQLAAIYNTALLEAATPEVREALCSLLVDTHRAAQALFEEMNSRGWYPVKCAEEQKLMQEKQRFCCPAKA